MFFLIQAIVGLLRKYLPHKGCPPFFFGSTVALGGSVSVAAGGHGNMDIWEFRVNGLRLRV